MAASWWRDERAARTRARFIVSPMWQAGVELWRWVRALTGMPKYRARAVVEEGRVAVDGVVCNNAYLLHFDESVFAAPGPALPSRAEEEAQDAVGPTVTLSLAGMEAQSFPAGIRYRHRASVVLPPHPTRPGLVAVVPEPAARAELESFLARIVCSRYHPYLLGVEECVRELAELYGVDVHIAGAHRFISARTSFHRKVIHSVAAWYGLESATMRDEARERGWWDYGHCTCCIGDACHDFEFEGFHAVVIMPVKVVVGADAPPALPAPIATLALRRSVALGAGRATDGAGTVSDGGAGPSAAGGSTVLGELPDELLLLVFSLLDVADLVRLMLVSRRLGAVARDNSIWRDLFLYYVVFDNPRTEAYQSALAGLADAASASPDVGSDEAVNAYWYAAYVRAFPTMVHSPGCGAIVSSMDVGPWAARRAEERAAAIETTRARRGGFARLCVASRIHLAGDDNDDGADR